MKKDGHATWRGTTSDANNVIVPSRPRALTKGQSQRVVGPLVGPKEGSQQIDRLRHRRVEASPIGGIALLRRRLRKASPG